MIDINNFDAIEIGLASSNRSAAGPTARSRSRRRSTTATLRPEKDGLFERAHLRSHQGLECYCGKYKRVRYAASSASAAASSHPPRCAFERMGHIDLAAPVSHIWFFKGVPSRIGYLLDMAPKDLEKSSTSPRRSSPGSTRRRVPPTSTACARRFDETIEQYGTDKEERVLELRSASTPRAYLQENKQDGFDDDDYLWAELLRRERRQARRGGSREAPQGPPQEPRARDRRHHPPTRKMPRSACARPGSSSRRWSPSRSSTTRRSPRAARALRLAVRLR